jgi:integrase
MVLPTGRGQAVAKKSLTDRTLKALKPASAGKTYDTWDASFPGFGVRVSDKGRVTFVLAARFAGSKNPTRRALGMYGPMTLQDARNKARRWLGLIERGTDPADEEERARQAELRKQANSFAAVAEEFINYLHRQKLRTVATMERDLRQTFVAAWGRRPVTDINTRDVGRIIGAAVDREAKYQAFHDFALIRRFFNWAIGTDRYGLERNPCDRLNTRDLIGEREARDRVLNDDELRALWRASARMNYPYAPVYRLLLLTGLRLDNVCGARWPEFDLNRKAWTIPAERMKKVKGGEKPFLVPLTDAMLEVLEVLPRFAGGDVLFSHSHGKRPLRPDLFSDPKEKLDRLMLAELQHLAVERGDDPNTVELRDWVNHDIRRTVRTRLSALKINEEVREAVLAHVRPGIKKVYDLHDYAEEKRDALTQWAARLRSIVNPPPSKVISFACEAVR